MKNWRKTLLILWLGQVISLMSFGFGVPFLPYYVKTMGIVDPDQVKFFTGLLNVAPAITMAITAPIWGKLSDKYGRKLMILRAMFSASLLIALMGVAPNVYVLLALRTLQGMFTGTVAASQTFVASYAPKKELAFSLGFLSSAQFLGYSIGPVLGGFTGDIFGYRISFFIGGAVMLMGALLCLFFLHEDKSNFVRKENVGLERESSPSGFAYFFRIVGILLFSIMLQRFIRTLFSPFLPLYLEELHGSEKISTVTGIVSMFVSLATALSGLTLTRLADRMNKNNLIRILLGISLAFSVVLRIFAKDFYSFVIIYTILFFFLGGIEPIMTSLSSERVDPKNRGSLFGIQAMLGSAGFMFAPIAGSFVSINFGYRTIFTVMAISIIINLIFNNIDIRGERKAFIQSEDAQS